MLRPPGRLVVLGVRLLLLLGIWGAASRDSQGQVGGELRYKWQPNATLAYEIEITADTPAALEAYKGRAAYTLDGTADGQLKLTCTGGLIGSKKMKANRSR
jgi:hypothetical protein